MMALMSKTRSSILKLFEPIREPLITLVSRLLSFLVRSTIAWKVYYETINDWLKASISGVMPEIC